MSVKQVKLRRETQSARELGPRHEAHFPRQERDGEAHAQQRGRSDAPIPRRHPQDRERGQRKRHAQQADADHPAAVGQRERDLKQPMHVDVRAAGERIGERIDGRPRCVLEDPAPGGEVISKIAGGFRPPREEHRQGRYRRSDREPGPWLVPRKLFRCWLRWRRRVGVRERGAAVATSSTSLSSRTRHRISCAPQVAIRGCGHPLLQQARQPCQRRCARSQVGSSAKRARMSSGIRRGRPRLTSTNTQSVLASQSWPPSSTRMMVVRRTLLAAAMLTTRVSTASWSPTNAGRRYWI